MNLEFYIGPPGASAPRAASAAPAAVETPHGGIDTGRIDRLIADIDARVGSVVDAILHHPEFQALEASWRGLHFVVERVAFEQNVEIEIWDCTKQELQDDFSDAPDITRLHFFRNVYVAEYGQFGGRPYAAIFANFTISHEPPDVALLRSMAAVSAMAHAPTFVAAAPKLLRLTSFAELPLMSNPQAVFDDPAYTRWNAFRETEDSRYVGVLLPRMLLRLPYRDATGSAESFVYDETVDDERGTLWGSPIFAFAVRLADSFARFRTSTGLLGTTDDEAPVLDSHPALGDEYVKPPVEVLLSRRLEQGLSGLGIIPLTCDPVRATLRFATASSLQMPKTFGTHEGGEAATLNHLLGTRLPHLLLVSRFAHYLKVLERERIGGHRTRDEVERELNEWLAQYVNQMPNPSMATRLRFPLRAARVRTGDVNGAPGWYRMDVLIQPHLRYMGQSFTLSVTGRIDTR